MNLKEDFTPPEQAAELKELLFDEPCFGYYVGLGDNKEEPYKLVMIHSSKGQFEGADNAFHAPTFSQAFRWFKKKYKIISVIGFYNDGEEWEDTEYNVTISEFEHFATHDTFVKEGYVTPEEAELACLVKLIEIVKNKNK